MTALFVLALAANAPCSRRSFAGAIASSLCHICSSHGAKATAPANGLFPDCPLQDNCVSSQDDRPQAWDNPWDADDPPEKAMLRLRQIIETKLKGDVVEADGRYIRAKFESNGLTGKSIDDAEFFYAPNDTLIQFRAERRGESKNDFGANRKRLEQARIALGYEKVPVLRNRRRALVVVESPLDSFGPAMYERDELGFTARDLVPAEANRREMYRDLDPKSSPWVTPTVKMKELKASELGENLNELWRRESDDRVRSK
eukprot:CAMPEP_0119306534 /NCGR_PEP_ID=MMETSP1333-20130426/7269_1 /TAXON_ID=418940 /ORGANISM="Scyphosphaera apsteinii, Strain RCC1455" /LENGTH=257 /DNA_ID=CAMNT_0007309853 /DNA_START=27 /DNA_END=800 /DNA_ORIENTATION=+